MIPIGDDNPRRHRAPYVNIALIVLNALVLFYMLGLNNLEETQFFYRWGVIPFELTQNASFTELRTPFGLVDIETPGSDWITLLTSMFVHGGVLHIAGNMIFLWVFGDNIEDRLGHFWYLVFYLATGVAAAWSQIAIDVDSQVPTVGASGALAGVLGAYLVLYPFARVRTLVIFFFIVPIRVPAVYLLGFWILLQFFSGVGSFDDTVTSGVAYWAHVGGFVAGMAIILFLKLFIWREPLWPNRRRRVLPPEDDDRWQDKYWRGRRL